MDKILAVDFDGTIVEHKFPAIGKPIPGAFEVLKALKKAGVKVFLWTMRGHPDYSKYGHTNYETGEHIEQDTLQEAVDFCKENGLEFDGINESPAQFSTSKKQYAQIYIDDAALGCPRNRATGQVDWIEIAALLFRLGWLDLSKITS